MKRTHFACAYWVVCLAAGLALACSSQDAPSNSSKDNLYQGQPTGLPDLMGVGVYVNTTGGECTVSYIGNRTILFAAHCISDVAQGCGEQTPGSTVTFADQAGNRIGGGAQTISLLGTVPHPQAYAYDLGSCGNITPPLPCPDPQTAPWYYQYPSCELQLQCSQYSLGYGWQPEHDLALGYLESDPVGIAPLPVIVGEGQSAPPKNLYSFVGLDAFLQGLPTLTLCGYGLGSTGWPDGAGNTIRGRDFGTGPLSSLTDGVYHGVDCQGIAEGTVTAPFLTLTAPNPWHAYLYQGDSGSPLLLGAGTYGQGMDPPTPLPTPLPAGIPSQGRYVIAVASQGSGPAIACTTSGQCPGSMTCVSGFCVYPGELTPPDPWTKAAPTYSAGNGSWLLARVGDIDGDGVPDASDNCVAVANPDQLNCNLDAEIDRNAQVMGDACDPVPCPDFIAPVSLQVPVSSDVGSCQGYVTTRNLRDQLHTTTIGSHNPLTGAVAADYERETRFRFCQIDPANAITCAIGDLQRQDDQFTNPPAPFSGQPWLPTTLPGVPGSSALYDYPSTHAPELWDYWTDRVQWVANYWITDPGTPVKPGSLPETMWTTASGLDGVFGLRGPWSQTFGTTIYPDNGVHPSPDNPVGQKLMRHYVTMSPDKIGTVTFDSCLPACVPPCSVPVDPTVIARWCPMCNVRPDGWLHPSDPSDLVLAKSSNGTWGVVTSNNAVTFFPDLISPEIQSKLSDSRYVFVASAEPYSAAQSAANTNQALFVYADGSGVDSGMSARDGSFESDRSVATGAQLIPRTDFIPVYSRRLDTVFIVGGSGPRGPLHEIWMLRLDGSLATLLSTAGYQPDEVLAAVTSFTDNTLWVLDTPSVGSSWRRLVRIDPASGSVATVWNGAGSGGFSKTWLLSDRDGSVLAVSNASRNSCTLRFSAKPFELGTESATLMRTDSGVLTGPPLVDRGGYQLVTRNGDSINSVRVPTLVDQSGGYPQVEQCL